MEIIRPTRRLGAVQFVPDDVLYARLNRKILSEIYAELDTSIYNTLLDISAMFALKPTLMKFEDVLGGPDQFGNMGLSEGFLRLDEFFGSDGKFEDACFTAGIWTWAETQKTDRQGTFASFYAESIVQICQARDRIDPATGLRSIKLINILDIARGKLTLRGRDDQAFIIANRYKSIAERLAAWTLVQYPDLFPQGVFPEGFNVEALKAATKRITEKDQSLDYWFWYSLAPMYSAVCLEKLSAKGLPISSFSYLGDRQSVVDGSGLTATRLPEIFGDLVVLPLGNKIAEAAQKATCGWVAPVAQKTSKGWKAQAAEQERLKKLAEEERLKKEAEASKRAETGRGPLSKVRDAAQAAREAEAAKPALPTTDAGTMVTDPNAENQAFAGMWRGRRIYLGALGAEVTVDEEASKFMDILTASGCTLNIIDAAIACGKALGPAAGFTFFGCALGAVAAITTLYVVQSECNEKFQVTPGIRPNFVAKGAFGNDEDDILYSSMAAFFAQNALQVMAWTNGKKQDMQDELSGKVTFSDAMWSQIFSPLKGTTADNKIGALQSISGRNYLPSIMSDNIVFLPGNWRGRGANNCVANAQGTCNGPPDGYYLCAKDSHCPEGYCTCVDNACVACRPPPALEEKSNAWIWAIGLTAVVGIGYAVIRARKNKEKKNG